MLGEGNEKLGDGKTKETGRQSWTLVQSACISEQYVKDTCVNQKIVPNFARPLNLEEKSDQTY